MARVVTLVHGVSESGERRALTRDDVGFAYRRTALPAHFVITRVDFELACGAREALWARVMELRTKRASRQPHGLPNAGSVFKNPPGNFAGRLLENAGLKGMRVGGAAFSQEHANFIVNLGDARADEVRELMELARLRVRASTGVTLEPEVRLVGDW
jgi:UDP-N-acetylmuramate dehydrogenase